jgi:hypothetical protein
MIFIFFKGKELSSSCGFLLLLDLFFGIQSKLVLRDERFHNICSKTTRITDGIVQRF